MSIKRLRRDVWLNQLSGFSELTNFANIPLKLKSKQLAGLHFVCYIELFNFAVGTLHEPLYSPDIETTGTGHR